MRRLLPTWVWWLAVAGVLALNVYAYVFSHNPTRVTLTYSQFLEQVSAANVATVDITGQQVTGNLRSAIAQPGSGSASGTPAPAGSSSKQAQTSSKFETTLPPFTDDKLLPALKDQNVGVTVHEAGQSFISSLLINGLPLLLFGALIFFMYRQGRGTQNQLFGFGRSRARLHTGE